MARYRTPLYDPQPYAPKTSALGQKRLLSLNAMGAASDTLSGARGWAVLAKSNMTSSWLSRMTAKR